MSEKLSITQLSDSIQGLNKKLEGRTQNIQQSIDLHQKQMRALENKQNDQSIKIDNIFEALKEKDASVQLLRKDTNKNTQNIDILLRKNNEKYLQEIMQQVKAAQEKIDQNHSEALKRFSEIEKDLTLKFLEHGSEFQEHDKRLKEFESAKLRIYEQIERIEELNADLNVRLDQTCKQIKGQEEEFRDMREYFNRWKKSQLNNQEKYDEFQEQKSFLRKDKDEYFSGYVNGKPDRRSRSRKPNNSSTNLGLPQDDALSSGGAEDERGAGNNSFEASPQLSGANILLLAKTQSRNRRATLLQNLQKRETT